jgi:hypothetical protein
VGHPVERLSLTASTYLIANQAAASMRTAPGRWGLASWDMQTVIGMRVKRRAARQD